MAEVPTARAETIDSSELGFTLMVEHVFNVDLEVNFNWPETFGDEEERIAKAIEDLKTAKENGVDTLCDRSLPGIGRNVPRIKRVAEQSPVNVLITTGFYTWRDIPLMFWFREQYADRLPTAKRMDYYFERDIEEGVADTGVRAAFLKCSIDQHGLTEGVEAVTRAVARTHRRTGVPITTHSNGAERALEHLAVFSEEGVDPSRILIGHIDKTLIGSADDDDFERRVELVEKVLATGASVSADMVAGAGLYGITETRERLIQTLIERGYAERLLLSHDLPSYTDLMPQEFFETDPSYRDFPRWTELQRSLLPALQAEGVTDEQVDQIMIANPRRILESRELGAY